MKFITANTKEPNTVAVPSQPDNDFGIHFPKIPLTTKPINGKNIINVNISLSFQLVQKTNIGLACIAIHQNQNGQAYCRFCRRYNHDKKHENLSVRIPHVSRKRRKQQVHRIEHQLDTHQKDDGISAK
jgi:hypothetical protein